MEGHRAPLAEETAAAATDGIACRQLSVAYTRRGGQTLTVLRDVDACFPPGRIALITGPTGSGKSTLLHTLAGLIRPTAGEVSDGHRAVSRWIGAHRDVWRRKIGMVFQHPCLLPDLTVLENVLLPLVPGKNRLATIRRQAMTALESLNLAHLAGEQIHPLSGGERQRVSIARALATGPAIFLADEPTAHQDDDFVQVLLEVFSALKQRNTVVILAAHDPRIAVAAAIDDRYQIADSGLRLSP